MSCLDCSSSSMVRSESGRMYVFPASARCACECENASFSRERRQLLALEKLKNNNKAGRGLCLRRSGRGLVRARSRRGRRACAVVSLTQTVSCIKRAETRGGLAAPRSGGRPRRRPRRRRRARRARARSRSGCARPPDDANRRQARSIAHTRGSRGENRRQPPRAAVRKLEIPPLSVGRSVSRSVRVLRDA